MSKISGISKRWFTSTFIVIVGIILIFAATAISIVYVYFYNYVEMTLNSHASELVNTYFSNYIGGSEENFIVGAINFTEDFSDKDMMDVWVINKNGKPIVSSSGFDIEDDLDMPDYTLALESENGKGIWKGRLKNGEKVMAVTAMLPKVQHENSGAVRYISSLEDVDTALWTVAAIVIVFCACIVVLVYASGRFFIRSIVGPVVKINATAKTLATGDLNVRVDNSGMRDEIDELCTTFNDMAGALSEAEIMKNDFISTVSHELRTPLTAIKGWGETLAQIGSTDPETTQKGMDVIIRESQRLSGMVEELLDFSRIQSGKMQLVYSKIDVLAELDDAILTFKERFSRENIELDYSVPEVSVPLVGDSARIRQVFVNLLDNAIKYNKKGGKVSVDARLDGAKIVIVFADTGCGISRENLPKIKEKFFRANISVHGNGIGLAVADEIIKLHGGTLEVDSVLNEGTTVTVTLPVN